jgi:hypothetical protein
MSCEIELLVLSSKITNIIFLFGNAFLVDTPIREGVGFLVASGSGVRRRRHKIPFEEIMLAQILGILVIVEVLVIFIILIILMVLVVLLVILVLEIVVVAKILVFWAFHLPEKLASLKILIVELFVIHYLGFGRTSLILAFLLLFLIQHYGLQNCLLLRFSLTLLLQNLKNFLVLLNNIANVVILQIRKHIRQIIH